MEIFKGKEFEHIRQNLFQLGKGYASNKTTRGAKLNFAPLVVLFVT